MSKYQKEPNLMQYYFDINNPVYRVLQQMRGGFIAGKPQKFDSGLVMVARSEIDKTRTSIDNSTYKFAQDLNYHIFGGVKRKRVVLLVEGTLYGKQNIESVIGIDLGDNPHELFKRHAISDTIDSHVTYKETQKFLAGERGRLTDESYRIFQINASKFFYFDEEELAKFERDGKIDMVALVPLVTEPTGFVVTTNVKVPSEERYQGYSPRFVSYRLKTSLQQKLLRKLTLNEIDEEEIISDWVAHRVVVATESEARDLEAFFRRSPKIEQSKIEYILTKDYYTSRKPSTFRSFNVVVKAHTRGHQPCVREIQIVDRRQYYENEINPNSPAHHKKHKRRQRLSRRNAAIIKPYEEVLEQMFGREILLIPI